MANTFLKGLDLQVGASLVENDRLKDAEELYGKAGLYGITIMLPEDVVIADAFNPAANHMTVDAHSVPETPVEAEGWRILDIGPETAAAYSEVIQNAKTIVWNGPMGVFEMEPYAEGTRAVARAVCDATRNGATSIVGGGDSVAAVEQMGLADCVSQHLHRRRCLPRIPGRPTPAGRGGAQRQDIVCTA